MSRMQGPTLPEDRARTVATTRKWIQRLMVCMGAVLLVAGIVLFARQMLFASSAMSAVGTVIELVANAESPSVPVVEFVTHDGQVIHFQGVAASPGPARGDTVSVLYSHTEVHDAKINSFMQLWFPASLLTGWGAAFIVLPRYISAVDGDW